MTFIISNEGRTDRLAIKVQGALPPAGEDDKRYWIGYEHQCASKYIMRDVIKRYVDSRALMIRVQIETSGRPTDVAYDPFLVCEYVYLLTSDGYKVHWLRSGLDKQADIKASAEMLTLINEPCNQDSLDNWVKFQKLFTSNHWDTKIEQPLTFP